MTLARAADHPDLHSTLILGGYDFSPSAHRNWKDYLPGGGIISTLGWDAYPPGSAKNQNPIAAPPATFMDQEIAAAKSVGLPYGFAEFGLSTPAGRPAWLTKVGNYLMTSGALFATYWNGNVQYPTRQADGQRVGRRVAGLYGQVRLRHLGASTSIASAEPHGNRDVAPG